MPHNSFNNDRAVVLQSANYVPAPVPHVQCKGSAEEMSNISSQEDSHDNDRHNQATSGQCFVRTPNSWQQNPSSNHDYLHVCISHSIHNTGMEANATILHCPRVKQRLIHQTLHDTKCIALVHVSSRVQCLSSSAMISFDSLSTIRARYAERTSSLCYQQLRWYCGTVVTFLT